MVTAAEFRAGLLFGEPGVGKTSLVRAGLIPHLRDHGIVALACEDLAQPAASFAAGLSSFGIQPTAGEAPATFITRAVANAVAGQLFVFVIDDAECCAPTSARTQELSEVFAKVVSRSAGRARFLFVAASERMHVLGALERRTGSLFPPSTRSELARMSPAVGGRILDRVLSLSGVAAESGARRGGRARRGPRAAVARREYADLRDGDARLQITSLAALQRIGGATESNRRGCTTRVARPATSARRCVCAPSRRGCGGAASDRFGRAPDQPRRGVRGAGLRDASSSAA